MKSDFTIKNINMSGGEFILHFEKLLRRAINYSILHMIEMYEKYYSFKEDITPFRTELMTEDIKEKVKYYEEQMKYYKEFFEQLNNIWVLELKSESFNERLEVMKEFNNIVEEWMLKEPGI